MSNSRWFTDGNRTLPVSSAISDTSDADVTLRTVQSPDHASASSAFSNPTFSRANRPPCLLKELKSGSSSCSEAICVPPVLLSPVLSRPIRSTQSTTSPLPINNNAIAIHGSDSENSDSAQCRGSGGNVSVPRRSLASGSRSSTPVMSPIMNRSSSGSRLGAFHLMSRSGSGSGLLPGRSLIQRTNSGSENDRRQKRLRRRTMIYGWTDCAFAPHWLIPIDGICVCMKIVFGVLIVPKDYYQRTKQVIRGSLWEYSSFLANTD